MSSEISPSYTGIPVLQLPSGKVFELNRPLTIGRAADNDVVIDHPSVSRHHCAISPSDGALILVDRQSSAGTVVNGGRRIEGPHVLQDRDRIHVGAVELQVRLPKPSDAERVPSPGSDTDIPNQVAAVELPATRQPVNLYLRRGPGAPRLIAWRRQNPFTIGRAADSSLAVSDDLLSRHHAEIQDKDGVPVLLDLGSANGSFLNGARVSGTAELSEGDCIGLGPLEIVYAPQPAPQDAASLVLRGGAEDGHAFVLNGSDLVVGRATSCDIVLSDDSVSRQQARIQQFGPDFWLSPIGDKRPILNNSPVQGPMLLRSGDVLQFGAVTVVFRQEAAAPGEQAARRAESLTLRQIVPFNQLAEDVFEALSHAGQEVSYDARTVITEPLKGKKAKDGVFYVLLEGEAEVRAPVADDWDLTLPVARLYAGDYVGERVLAHGVAYPHRVEAVSRVRAFRVTQKDFESLRGKYPALVGFYKDKVSRHGLVKYLREIPLFSHVSAERLDQVADRAKLRSFPQGDVLVRNGELVRTLFLVASGTCKVNSLQRGELTLLTYLTEGKYVGEQIAGPEEVSPYAIVAETAGDAYTISRDDYLKLAQEAPESLDFGAAGVPPSVILARTPPFDALAPELVAETAHDLRVKHFRAGETVIYQDDPVGSAFYIIVRGKVDVLFRARDGQERSLAQLKAGQCFGEAALLTNEPRNATVKALEDCQLLTLYRREFNMILAKSPMKMGAFLGHTFNARFRPKHIDDVETFEQQSGSGISYILKNPARNTYISLSEQGFFIWNLLDGEHTMNDIAAAYYQKYSSLAMGVMFGTIMQLQQLGFIDVKMDELMKAMRQGFHFTPMQKAMFVASKILQAKVEFKKADVYFRAMYNGFFKFFFAKPVLLLIAIINVVGLVAFIRMQVTGASLSGVKLTGWSILIFWICNAIIIVTHEMGHGLTMIHVGRKVLGAGVGFNYVSPMAFVNTTDAWLATKGQRLAVTGAGPIVSITEAALSTIGLLLVHNPVLKTAFAAVAYMGYVGLFINTAPMLPTDGYNFLMDLLAIPDLRPRALRYLFSGNLWRDLLKRQMNREQKAFTIFAVIVAVFMIFLSFEVAISMSLLVGPHLRGHLPDPAVLAVKVLLSALVISFFLLAILREAGFGGRKAAG